MMYLCNAFSDRRRVDGLVHDAPSAFHTGLSLTASLWLVLWLMLWACFTPLDLVVLSAGGL